MQEMKILGTGKYFPEKIMTNDDLSKLVDTNDQWITERTGIKERRISDLSKDEFPSGMAEHASRMALKEANLEPNDIDLILFSVTIPDMLFPNTASRLQERLGITNMCGCLDINAACSGWVYGLELANSLIKTGVHKHILLVGCEMTSGFNNWEDRSTCILFGDGAGAVVLGASKDGESQLYSSVLSSDSSKKDSLILPHGGAHSPITYEILDKKQQFCQMDGQIVFKNAVKTMAMHSLTVLNNAGITMDQVNWFIPHQANLRIIEATANRLEFPMEKVIINVQKYANTSSASIPAALNEAIQAGKIKRGDIILVAAFGAGLTSAAAVFKF
jgi:3-oxoacyl-[acyl-carrier-protein] synthase-3